jgi:hypothetical protein
MGAMGDLKAGLTDDQKRKAALQREQLKRDLEEQMRAKKEVEARSKQQLAEQEAREEAALRAFYARQQAEAAGEQAGGAAGAGGVQEARHNNNGGGAAHAAGADPGMRAHSDLGSAQAGVVVMVPSKKPSRVSLEGSAPQPTHEQQYASAAALPSIPPVAPSPAALLLPPQMPANTQLPHIYSPYIHPLALGTMQVPGFNPFVMPNLVAAAPAPSGDGGASTQVFNAVAAPNMLLSPL